MDDLVRLLDAVQPYRDSDLATEPICDAVADVGLEVLAPVARRRRWRRWWVAAAAAGVVLVGIPAVAHQSGVALHTSEYGSHDSDAGDPDAEWMRMDAKGAPQLLRKLAKDYPLAPGYRLEPLIESWTSETNAQSQLADWRGAVLGHSFCTWEAAWLDAETNPDRRRGRAKQADAADVLRLRAEQTVTVRWPGQTTDYFRDLAMAAASGDAAALRGDLKRNCGPLR